MPPGSTIPLEGVLNSWTGDYDLPDLLLAVSQSGRTGRLQFSNAEGEKTLFVKDGRFIFAESSSDDDALGQYLLRNGRISLQEFTRASKRVEPGKRLGALLVAEKVLEPKDLVPAVVGQVRAIILGLFRRTESWYGFKQEELPRKESITLDMPVAQLILDGLQLVDSWRRVSRGIGELETVWRLVPESEAEWSRLKLEPGVVDLLARLEAPSPLEEVCTGSGLADFDACRYLWGFRVLGWMEPAVLEPAVAADAGAEVPDDISAELAAESAHAVEADYTRVPRMTQPVQPAPPAKPARPVPPAPPARPVQPAPPVQPTRAPQPARAAAPPEPEPVTAAAAEAGPAMPRVDPSVTVMDVAPLPQHLVKTKVAVKPPAGPRVPAVPPPPPIPKDLAQTRLHLSAPDAAASVEPAAPRAPVPDELMHTRLYLSGPSAPSGLTIPSPHSSTGEMMEAILEGDADPPAARYDTVQTAPSVPIPNDATRLFTAPSALEEPVEDFFHGAPDFASLSLDYAPREQDAAPAQPVVEDPGGLASFQDLSMSMPLIEATVIEATVIEATVVEEEGAEAPPAPVVEASSVAPELVVTQPSAPGVPAGMEIFAMTDPFSTPAFATDDPFQPTEPAAAPATRQAKSENLDLDIDGLEEVFGED